jgi:peptidoglycan/LPS O-acetylase OafA/YrhL
VKEAATRIPSLDGLRAASVMLVFASHAGFARETVGGLGVDVFFFLSGYLITTLLRVEEDSTGSVSIRRFFMRRALRVLPPLYTVALVAIVVTLVFYPSYPLYRRTLASQMLFYFNYYSLYSSQPGVPGLGVVWSLAVEEHFYVLFPLLYVAMQTVALPRRIQSWILWSLCAAILAWRVFLVFHLHADANRIYPTTDTRLDSILFGCALAICCNPHFDNSSRTDPAVPPGRWKYLLLPTAAVAILWCVTNNNPTFQITASFSIQGLALSILFVAAVRFYDWIPFRVLNWRPITFIGDLSYSLYLVHEVFLRAAKHVWPNAHVWQRALVALLASFIASLLIYVVIEKPCGSLRRRLNSPVAPKTRAVPMTGVT